ncbi:MAG: dihydrodipicolinate synthase family protein [Bradyrhizobium sp.]|uniref:dihydrodipicolinate synthase family protein n=1 Tax=Bradyrhizobium sp. TaxID=376 RepID=UPI000B5849E5|nr:dihydrodipicolinate synthase family protein [Bradyrhizobium sp.]ART39436.1 J508 [uncultured bacterium]MDX3969236.1 dihydrodipicolinate synthase family protein [Bradyrhizobium sp.]
MSNLFELTAADVKGVWAIVPTPSKADLGSLDAPNTVDLDEAARAVDALIKAGVDGILSLGTFGECATVTWVEKRSFMATIAEAARGRVPVFGGTTTLNTRDTIAQTRELPSLGISGTMLGLPMWVRCNERDAVRFYADVAEYCPKTSICLYANRQAFKFDYPSSFWAAVSQIRQIVCAKYLTLSQMEPDLAAVGDRIALLTNEVDYLTAAKTYPERISAFWSSSAACGPATVLHLRDAVTESRKTGDWTKADAVGDAIFGAEEGFFPLGQFEEFSKYNIALEKGRMDAAGWMRAGPTRPPYREVPSDYLAAAQRSGRAYAALHKRYSKVAA